MSIQEENGNKENPGESFDLSTCHVYARLTNTEGHVVNTIQDFFAIRYILGDAIYAMGQHEVRFILDNVEDFLVANIGMTSYPSPPMDNAFHSPGLSSWYAYESWHISPNDGLQMEGDVGQPWINGDVIYISLDCLEHKLCMRHGRIGKTHTIYDVTGHQRLFISYLLG